MTEVLYVGCYGCEKCPDELEGYDVVYEDGRKYFRSGAFVLDIFSPPRPEYSQPGIGIG
jgi:hypothetical protein